MIQQGHKYLYRNASHYCPVIAVESSESAWVKVAELDDSIEWLGRRLLVPASSLTKLPMKYFHGQIPK